MKLQGSDWGHVRNAYIAILNAIEEGEMTWSSSFNEYDELFPQKELPRKAVTNKKETYWCKDYKRGTCTESGSHMGPVGKDGDKKWVQHICAACWKLKKKSNHAVLELFSWQPPQSHTKHLDLHIWCQYKLLLSEPLQSWVMQLQSHSLPML